MKQKLAGVPSAILMGLVLGVVRIIEMITSYRGTSHLTERNSVMVYVFWGLVLVFAAVEVIVRFPFQKKHETFERLLGSQLKPLFLISGLLLLIFSGYTFVQSFSIEKTDVIYYYFTLISAILGILSSICLLLLSFYSQNFLMLKNHPGPITLMLPYFGFRCIYYLWYYSVEPSLDYFLPYFLPFLIAALAAALFAGLAFGGNSSNLLQFLAHFGVILILCQFISAVIYSIFSSGLMPTISTLLSNLELASFLFFLLAILTSRHLYSDMDSSV